MPVKYNNRSIIPAPFVSITKEILGTDDGTKIGTTYAITLKGTLSAEKGSPTSSGTFWTASDYPPDEVFSPDDRMGSLLRKQEALANLFGLEGCELEIQTPSEAYSRKCNPRVKRIDFPEGGQGSVSWFDKMPYTISLEADALYLTESGVPNPSGYEDREISISGYKISKASEDWSIELADERTNTYRLSHTLSATGKRFFSGSGYLQKQAWENARDYVLDRIGLGIDSSQLVATGVMNNNLLSAYNHTRSVNVGELAGTYQVAEHWLCFNPGASGVPAIDEHNYTVRSTQEGRISVQVEGTITGLEVRDPSTFLVTSSKYSNASNKWTNYVFPNLYANAAGVAGVTLHPTAVSTSVSFNDVGGVISYHWEFDDRPTASVSGCISENITVTNHNQTDVFASIPVLGRVLGPVLQDISTNSAKKRQVQVELVMRAKSQSYTPTQPDTDALIATYIPTGTVFLDQDDETWNEFAGRYSRNVSWTWE